MDQDQLKATLWKQVQDLLSQMPLLQAKCPEISLKHRELRDIQAAYNFLESLKINEYYWVHKIYVQLTPDQWAYYEALNVSDMPEQELLQKYKKAMLERWKSRPSILKAKHRVKSKSASEGQDSQPSNSDSSEHSGHPE